MAIFDPEYVTLLQKVLRALAFVILYILIGFGPGYILGVLLANATAGRGKQLRVDKHQQAVERAAEHNKQWKPEDPRWQP